MKRIGLLILGLTVAAMTVAGGIAFVSELTVTASLWHALPTLEALLILVLGLCLVGLLPRKKRRNKFA